jgi:threonine/homoserine/homoserine lactone efflux protein
MPDAPTFGLFVAAALALLLVPGPSVLYVVGRGVEGGPSAGLVSVLGIGLGTLGHVAFAAAGLSAIVASSATAFSIVRWLGAAYLVWLGLRRLLGRNDADLTVNVESERLSRVFVEGVIVNLLNPKTALFFLAFLPQFVDPSRGPVWTQVSVLGLTLASLGLLTDGLYALLGGTAADWLSQRSETASFRRMRRYIPGGVYIALGVVTVVSGSGKE